MMVSRTLCCVGLESSCVDLMSCAASAMNTVDAMGDEDMFLKAFSLVFLRIASSQSLQEQSEQR